MVRYEVSLPWNPSPRHCRGSWPDPGPVRVAVAPESTLLPRANSRYRARCWAFTGAVERSAIRSDGDDDASKHCDHSVCPPSTSRIISAIDLDGVFAMTIIVTAGMRAMNTTAAHTAREAVPDAIHRAQASAETHVRPTVVFVMGRDIVLLSKARRDRHQRMRGVKRPVPWRDTQRWSFSEEGPPRERGRPDSGKQKRDAD